MRKTSLIIPTVAAIFTFAALTPVSHAGNVQRSRWEGLAIGIGTAILGSAIYSQYKNDHQQSYAAYSPAPSPGGDSFAYNGPGHHPGFKQHRRHDYRKHYDRRHHRPGHWEVRKEWVPPTYKKVWNPGHYSRRGEWVTGHWIEIEDVAGYWTETRVWVARR